MIAALSTLVFLATLWLLAVLGAAVLEESGAKIAAALKGEQIRHPPISNVPVRIRIRWATQPTRPGRASLRVAA